MADNVATLVFRAQRGDRAAFDKLYRHFYAGTYEFILARVHDHNIAEDLVSEVFLKAFAKLGTLHDPAAFPGWLRRIAKRVLCNHYARRRWVTVGGLMGGDEPNPWDNKPSTLPSPPEALIRKENREMVWAAVARLRPIHRQVIVRFYFKEQPVGQIARDLGVPVGTVKRRLHTARREVRSRLLGYEGRWLGRDHMADDWEGRRSYGWWYVEPKTPFWVFPVSMLPWVTAKVA